MSIRLMLILLTVKQKECYHDCGFHTFLLM